MDYDVNRPDLRAAGWPDFLIKALHDPFDYAVELRGGARIRFHELKYDESCPDWVTLHGHESQGLLGAHGTRSTEEPAEGMPPCPRGLQVRVSDILWIADAPHDS